MHLDSVGSGFTIYGGYPRASCVIEGIGKLLFHSLTLITMSCRQRELGLTWSVRNGEVRGAARTRVVRKFNAEFCVGF